MHNKNRKEIIIEGPKSGKNRESLKEQIKKVHKKHSTYGYRHIAQVIRNETGELFSDLLCHKLCKELGIKSKARKTWVRAGEEALNIQIL